MKNEQIEAKIKFVEEWIDDMKFAYENKISILQPYEKMICMLEEYIFFLNQRLESNE